MSGSFFRALLAAGLAFASKYVDKSGQISYSAASLRAALVGGGLAFSEVFTPLNGLAGVFKLAGGSTAASAPVAPIEPPVTPGVEGTEAPAA